MEACKRDPESLQKSQTPAPHTRPLMLPAAAAKPPEPFPWLSTIAFAFLTVNCVQAVYRASDDAWTVSFVVSAYAALVALFWCLRQLERLPRDGSCGREEQRLKLGVWALAMLLNGMFSYRVATMMPPAFAVVIWAIAGLTTLAGFYAFFIYRDPATTAAAGGTVPAVPPGKM